ncbi:MAG: hypothetical protein RR364_03090 [Lachnospiraceae bacterium]
MTIRPVDLNGMLQRTQDVSTIKHNEDHRPMVQQQDITVTYEKKMEKQLHQISHTEKETKREEKFDAKEEGKNKYQDNRKKEKKQKNLQETQDCVIEKKQSRSFDVKV